jgi:hypothetical protein
MSCRLAGVMPASRCGQRVSSDTGVVVKQVSAGRHRLCQAVASNAAAASATSGCGAEIGMEWGAVQAASKEADVCQSGSVAYCRIPMAAWWSVMVGQTRLAASHDGLRPTLLLRAMIKCGVFALSAAKSNGNRGTANNIQSAWQPGRGKRWALLDLI